MMARELFVTSLYMSTWPFVVGDVAFSTFSDVTCSTFLPMQTSLAIRATITLLSYNVVCYTLIFQASGGGGGGVVQLLLRVVGWATMLWNAAGMVCFPRDCGHEMLAIYYPVSLLALIVLYAWCSFPSKEKFQ